MKRKRALWILAVVCSLLCACGSAEQSPETTERQESEAEAEPVSGQEQEETEENLLWLAYWSYQGYEEELLCLGRQDTAVSVFGVLYDWQEDQPFLTQEAEELLQKVQKEKEEGERIYLSFINDLRLEDGSYSNKDPELLQRLFGNAEAGAKHAEEIVELACANGVDGVEIDYENIKKKEELWEPFCIFLKELSQRCEEKGLLLRVVLGAYDTDKAQFPEGIEYAVMCYNLYGTHSGPGPKADIAFLRETFERCRKLPGSVSAAFSTGGFVWAGESCEKALTEEEAEELYTSLGAEASELVRDEASGALHFTYTQEGTEREVWYADGETLSLWKQTAREYGIRKFSLWKAGGNKEESLRGFAEQ